MYSQDEKFRHYQPTDNGLVMAADCTRYKVIQGLYGKLTLLRDLLQYNIDGY